MNQMTFFDDEHKEDQETKRLYRRSHPDTSKQAASKLDVQKAEKRVLIVFESRRLDPKGLTGPELNRLMKSANGHKRLSRLLEKGKIELGGVRACRVNGTKCRWYRLNGGQADD